MRRIFAAAGVLLFALGLAGCVTSSKYKQMEAERDALRAGKGNLAMEIAKLKGDVSQLSSETGSLGSQRDSLAMERDSLRRERLALQAERDSLKSEGDALKKNQAETVSHYDALVKQLSQEVDDGHLRIKQYKNMLTVDVAEKIFFASGSADLKESGLAVLQKVGQALALYPDKIIRVVGHTDTIPLSLASQKVFPSNWELSVMRATHVVRFLQEQCKISPERLVAAGRGPYQPVATNATPEGRQKNRRIEIMLLDRSATEGVAAEAKER